MGSYFNIFKNNATKNYMSSKRHFIQTIKRNQVLELKPNAREYFYYVDHEGMLFLDDAKIKNFTSCFKEKIFLKSFFTQIKLNGTSRYRDSFPFLSLCYGEKNYIRCEDLPIVFTEILKDINGNAVISYNHAGQHLILPFEPTKIFVKPETGRIYHPAWPKVGNIGLVRSQLAIELSKNFEFQRGEHNPPTHFIWNCERLELNMDWIKETIKEKQ